MRITILGKRWNLIRGRCANDEDGYCTPPDQAGRTICIRPSLTGERRLEVEIHEMIHAAMWSLDEEFVEQMAKDLARNLTRIGYHLD